jgi:predicted O-methyltransferase YrrM
MKNSIEIDGWFGYEQTYDMLIDSVQTSGIFVECGAWLGKSSSYLADKIAESRPDISLYIVDSWQGSPSELTTTHKLVTTTDVYALFVENMGNRKYTPIRSFSTEAATKFQDESLDVVFIDMSHTYEDVKQDLDVWLPKVKKNGYIAGHDLSWTGVIKAIKEKFGNNVHPIQGDCWIFHKTGEDS